jgi:hypothetical protein
MKHFTLILAASILLSSCTKNVEEFSQQSKAISSSGSVANSDSVVFSQKIIFPKRPTIDSSIQVLLGDEFYLPKDCYIKNIKLSVIEVAGMCRNVWILLDGIYLQEIEHGVEVYTGDSVFAFAPNFPLKKGYHTVEFVGQTISTDKQNMYFDILQGDATFIDITAAVLPISGLPLSKERIFHTRGN